MKIITILGTRPEIIKLSPLIPLFDKEFDHKIIHTGQHYSYSMDRIFFDDLKLRKADYALNIGSGTHASQTGKMMMEIEKVLLKEEPDLVVVQGDTNSTLAGALTSSKLQIKVVHVEAGCRSFDRRMPEEINRTLVDHCADILFAPDKNAYNNLIGEGICEDKIHLVGNTSIDACLRVKNILDKDEFVEGLEKQNFALLTIHRQENTSPDQIKKIISSLNTISARIKIIFPVHLRTRKVLDKNNIKISENLVLTDPLGYKQFINLLMNSKFIISDSGGIQEEAAVLNVPCLILRDNTEWMYLVDIGKNVLLGTNEHNVTKFVNDILDDSTILENMRKIKPPVEIGASETILNILKFYS